MGIPPFCLSDFNISERPTKKQEPGQKKNSRLKRRLFLVAIFHYTARVTLPERRHLVQTYTWVGVPFTIAFTRLTLGFQVRLERR